MSSIVFSSSSSLEDCLVTFDKAYRTKLKDIPLFNTQQTARWTSSQKQRFASIFYHLRGHFIDFLWYLANFSEQSVKKIVMKNIEEEIGLGERFSHEKLYARFAEECGVDIEEELLNETHYLPFAKQFNRSHLRWLVEHGLQERFAAFAAYERLDNIDYPFLLQLAESLDLSSAAHAFFNVHVRVDHFEQSLTDLIPLWESMPEKVEGAFQFIYNHQLNMWSQLSLVMA